MGKNAKPEPSETALTVDTFFNGHLQVLQHRSGYRFSIDAVLLAHHACPRPGDTVLDLGTGCGIVSLILAYRCPEIGGIWGVEVQEGVAALAETNVKKNRMSDRIRVLCRDMKRLPDSELPASVDWVISNPPYRKAGSGRMNPIRERAVARHEILVELKDVVAVSRRMLKTAGKFASIYPAERITDLMFEMRSAGIEPKRVRMIHPKNGTVANRVLVEGAMGARPGVSVDPPLYIYGDDGGYTASVKAMFEP